MSLKVRTSTTTKKPYWKLFERCSESIMLARVSRLTTEMIAEATAAPIKTNGMEADPMMILPIRPKAQLPTRAFATLAASTMALTIGTIAPTILETETVEAAMPIRTMAEATTIAIKTRAGDLLTRKRHMRSNFAEAMKSVYHSSATVKTMILPMQLPAHVAEN